MEHGEPPNSILFSSTSATGNNLFPSPVLIGNFLDGRYKTFVNETRNGHDNHYNHRMKLFMMALLQVTYACHCLQKINGTVLPMISPFF